MLPWETIDTASTPDGTSLTLARRGTDWEVRAGGRTLMTSRMHGSEESLASTAYAENPSARAILVGGLGLGFTLRATLDHAPPDGRVVLAELSPSIVHWNRVHVGGLAGHPLDDPRVELRVGDVFARISEARSTYDAMLLDVDNGPDAMVQGDNDRLYGDDGVRACLRALTPGGVLNVWSAGHDDRYLRRLHRAGFDARAISVAAHRGTKGQHVLFLGVKSKRESERSRRR